MLSLTPYEYEAPILTRGGLIGVRGFPDGKPLSLRSLPRVRLPGLNVQNVIMFILFVLYFVFNFKTLFFSVSKLTKQHKDFKFSKV